MGDSGDHYIDGGHEWTTLADEKSTIKNSFLDGYLPFLIKSFCTKLIVKENLFSPTFITVVHPLEVQRFWRDVAELLW